MVKHLKESLGVILSTGIPLETILDMTFEQISICAETIMNHKVEMLNMVFEPISAALGGKKSTAKRSKSNKPKMTPKQKEDQKMAQLRYLGIGVQDTT